MTLNAMPPRGLWQRHREALFDLLLPVDCVACAGPGRTLCLGCRGALVERTPPLVQLPMEQPPPCAVAAPYGGPAREALLALKEHGRRGLSADLGTALAVAVARLGVSAPALIPVPPAPGSVRRRGEDTLGRLTASAERALRSGGIAVHRPRGRILRAARHWADQAGLGATARRANLVGALVARAPREHELGSRLVVIDDVITTGATAAEAVRALRTAGWRVHGVAALCATPLRQVARPRAA